jgi:hypothetical protein
MSKELMLFDPRDWEIARLKEEIVHLHRKIERLIDTGNTLMAEGGTFDQLQKERDYWRSIAENRKFEALSRSRK